MGHSDSGLDTEYEPGELVPRNSYVIVTRTPRENVVRLPKVQ